MSQHPETGLIMATYIEAKPFVEKIRWENSAEKPFPVYYLKNLALVVSGIGKVNAAAACAWLSAAASPKYIVNIGAAGANLDGLPPGRIYLIREALDADRINFKTGRPLCYSPDIMEGFETTRLATSDTPVLDPEQRRKAAAFAELSDMEGAAVIQTAQKFQARCFALKFISDTPQHTTGRQIAANIREHRESVFREVRGIIGV
ncbi:MAG: hypothetical protein ACOCY3_04340 [Desulfosalsimonas sp.]